MPQAHPNPATSCNSHAGLPDCISSEWCFTRPASDSCEAQVPGDSAALKAIRYAVRLQSSAACFGLKNVASFVKPIRPPQEVVGKGNIIGLTGSLQVGKTAKCPVPTQLFLR